MTSLYCEICVERCATGALFTIALLVLCQSILKLAQLELLIKSAKRIADRLLLNGNADNGVLCTIKFVYAKTAVFRLEFITSEIS